MSHASRGELFKFICHTDQFTEKLARTLFQKIVEAVECCHSHGIAHRDLKAENILLTEEFQIKLADLGSAIEQEEDSNPMFFGSDEYNPPEVLRHFDEFGNGCVDYDRFKGDVFSLGVLLFVMVLGLAPFRSARPTDPYYTRLSEAPQNFWKIFREYRLTDEFRIIIEAMTSRDPSDRPTLAEIKSSPWFTAEVFGDDELVSEMTPRDSMLKECALARESPREVCVRVKEPDFDAYKSTFDAKFEELR